MKPTDRNIGAALLVDLSDHLSALAVEKLGLSEAKAKEFANDAAAHVADHWGGQAIYIPMDMVSRLNSRNAEIYDAFTGDNVSDLVSQFNLSKQAIYRIIKAERERRSPKQCSLFATGGSDAGQ